MPIPLDSLRAPISPESPAGADVSYDPAFQELDTLVLGKPETQFSPAEPPDWAQVRNRCLELLARSKHLRLIATLGASLLRTEGLGGFRDSLKLLEDTVRNFWEPLYPRLDPDDNNDPTERMNIIASLAIPLGVLGDPYRFVEGLRGAALSNSAQMGRFSLDDFQRSQNPPPPAEGAKPPIPAAQVEAAFRDTKPEHLQGLHEAIVESMALVKSLGSVLNEKVGDRAPNFDHLTAALREIQKLLGSQGAGGPAGAAAPAESTEASGAPQTTAPMQVTASRPGAIESREEVIRALDAIAGYYVRREPSSPIPLLLDRAKRLVPMDFLAIIEDLASEGLSQVNLLAGKKAS